MEQGAVNLKADEYSKQLLKGVREAPRGWEEKPESEKAYEVLVSKKIQVEQNLPGHILTLRDRHIFTPENRIYWPAQENLDFHRRKKFRV